MQYWMLALNNTIRLLSLYRAFKPNLVQPKTLIKNLVGMPCRNFVTYMTCGNSQSILNSNLQELQLTQYLTIFGINALRTFGINALRTDKLRF